MTKTDNWKATFDFDQWIITEIRDRKRRPVLFPYGSTDRERNRAMQRDATGRELARKARLMAAAPALAEALEFIADRSKCCDITEYIGRWRETGCVACCARHTLAALKAAGKE